MRTIICKKNIKKKCINQFKSCFEIKRKKYVLNNILLFFYDFNFYILLEKQKIFLSTEQKVFLEQWYESHFHTIVHDKNKLKYLIKEIVNQTKLSRQQVTNWIRYSKKNPIKKHISSKNRLVLLNFFNQANFSNQTYQQSKINSNEIVRLCNETGLNKQQILNWISNERLKIKKAKTSKIVGNDKTTD